MNNSFAQRLASAVQRTGSPLVVGLDPRREKLPQVLQSMVQGDRSRQAEAYRLFCNSVVDAVADVVPAVKPQFAFFEELGPEGMKALHSVCQYAHSKGLMVLGDAKRGDIGSTATAYAAAYLGEAGPWHLDALTINPYMGRDTLQPFVDAANRSDAGVFVLAKTSNPGSGDLQDLTVSGLALSQHVADWLANLANIAPGNYGPEGLSNIGAVVGATYPEQLQGMRQRMPGVWILIPGFGAQGGTAADTAGGFYPSGLGALVNSSRGVIFAFDADDTSGNWVDAVRQAAVTATGQLREQTPAGNLS